MNTRNLSTALWQKSRHSNGQANCVEVAHNLPGAVAVRDSKQPYGPKLVFDAEEWQVWNDQLLRRISSERGGRLEPLTLNHREVPGLTAAMGISRLPDR